jgi:[ribosomal protein S5]-alanine N-acetyltransferase
MERHLPRLATRRLMLRAFTLDDAPAVTALCADEAIAATTLVIPHPYVLSDARSWIATHPGTWAAGTQANFAVTLSDEDADETGQLIGAMGLTIQRAHQCAELGYWIGRPWWGRGYATEAGTAVVRWGFHELGLNRVHAHHMAHNPASGRVLQKIGMKPEGVARQLVIKDGVARDCPMYAIVRRDLDGESV